MAGGWADFGVTKGIASASHVAGAPLAQSASEAPDLGGTDRVASLALRANCVYARLRLLPMLVVINTLRKYPEMIA